MRLGAGPTMTTRLIGARIPRNEDPRLLRGLGSFVDDIEPGGRAPRRGAPQPARHARVGAIDAARARALPGVHLVLTAADLGELNQPSPLLIPHPGLTQPRTQRPLATDEVRYTGETGRVRRGGRSLRGRGRRRADRRPSTSRLPVVTDARGGRSPRGRRWSTRTCPANRAARVVQRVGDPDAAFAQAAHVLRERLVHRAELRQPDRGARRRGRVRRAHRPAPGVDARRRRRSPSRMASRGSSACRSSRWRSIAPDIGRRLRHEDHAVLSRGDPGARTRRCGSAGPSSGPRTASSTSSARATSAGSSTTSRSPVDATGRILGLRDRFRPRCRRVHAVRHRRPAHHVDPAPRASTGSGTTRSNSTWSTRTR